MRSYSTIFGLAILKFAIRSSSTKNHAPASPSEFWTDAWPTHWGNWILLRCTEAQCLCSPAGRLAGNALALVAAVAMVRLAASFSHANCGWQSHATTLCGCRMPRLPISSRIGFGTRNAHGIGCLSGCWRRLHFALFGESTSGCLSSRKAGKCCWKADAPVGQPSARTACGDETDGAIVTTNWHGRAESSHPCQVAKGRGYGTLVYPMPWRLDSAVTANVAQFAVHSTNGCDHPFARW